VRLKGMSTRWCDLWQSAGVDAVVERTARAPADLHAKLAEVNAAKAAVRGLPGDADCAERVAQAKALSRGGRRAARRNARDSIDSGRACTKVAGLALASPAFSAMGLAVQHRL
jgi:hypothetical protein